ncbi:MAG: S24/S26 family peptidase [Clostridia bacterium]|nr:S24/S26 family peptidase [Clostridia bacterium]
MTGFELYVFFLCLIVFIALTALFSFFIFYVGKQRIIIIKNGIADEEITKSLNKRIDKMANKNYRIFDTIEKIASVSLCAVLCVLFILVGISSCIGDTNVKNLPAIKVIASTSMSEKYENNKHLFENDLNDQLQLFDVVLLHELPKEEDIELYDIVVYEHVSGALLIHRVIGIEEPNESHPNERYFLLQGDAVHYPDTFPVRYCQMKSIYKGERIPNVGSFVYFMQSPAGIICLILIVVSMLLMPIADKFIRNAEYDRVVILVENGTLDRKALSFYKGNGYKGGGENE